MNTFDYQQQDNKLQVTIYSKGPTWAKMVLAMLTLSAIIAFFSLAIKITQTDATDGITLVISLVIFGVVMSFLGRLLLWNTFGKELLIFKPGEFNFQYDYKLFKSEVEQIPFSSVKASRDDSEAPITRDSKIIDEDEFENLKDWDKGKLKLQFDQGQHLSPIELSKDRLTQLMALINDHHQ